MKNKHCYTYLRSLLNRSQPPAHITAGYMRIPVDRYVQNPLCCYNCQRFGHGKAHCRREQTCDKCGQQMLGLIVSYLVFVRYLLVYYSILTLHYHSLHFVVIKAESKASNRLIDKVEKALLQSKKFVEKKWQVL